MKIVTLNHLNNVKKIIPLLFFICLVISACGQAGDKKYDAAKQQEKLVYDTSKIAILPLDSAGAWLFIKAKSIQLTNNDLIKVNKLLSDCINTHNSKQDTTKRFNEYIDLHQYWFQYIPAIDSTGDRKVYVNAFCEIPGDRYHWKKVVLMVSDGGACFFQVMINLSKNKYEEFSTNGYGYIKDFHYDSHV